MRRVASVPRPSWQARVEESGLIWHSDPAAYWNESAFYEFTAREVEVLESATNALAGMALKAAQHIIDYKLYEELAIPACAVPLIEASWESEPLSLYGRFDFAYTGDGPPKLLEYYADTPTSLLEAALVQWRWLEDVLPRRDQFNSIHERLIACWKGFARYLPDDRIDLCSIDDAEDGMTVTYLMETARLADLAASIFPINEIGWNGEEFIGPHERALGAVFKLYPWEWMVREDFGRYLSSAKTIWIEPAWKMLLSNKGILPVLWKLYPDHPNLLAASFEAPDASAKWVRKPLLGREGANVTLHFDGEKVATGGDYGKEGFICQELAPLKAFDCKHAVIGSWVIGDDENCSAGIGIRESESPIITNTSQFVPHVID